MGIKKPTSYRELNEYELTYDDGKGLNALDWVLIVSSCVAVGFLVKWGYSKFISRPSGGRGGSYLNPVRKDVTPSSVRAVSKRTPGHSMFGPGKSRMAPETEVNTEIVEAPSDDYDPWSLL